MLIPLLHHVTTRATLTPTLSPTNDGSSNDTFAVNPAGGTETTTSFSLTSGGKPDLSQFLASTGTPEHRHAPAAVGESDASVRFRVDAIRRRCAQISHEKG